MHYCSTQFQLILLNLSILLATDKSCCWHLLLGFSYKQGQYRKTNKCFKNNTERERERGPRKINIRCNSRRKKCFCCRQVFFKRCFFLENIYSLDFLFIFYTFIEIEFMFLFCAVCSVLPEVNAWFMGCKF